MSNSNESVTTLVRTTSVPAPAITTALKTIGNGDMLDGIRAIAGFYYAQGALAEKMRSAKHEKVVICNSVIGTLAAMSLARSWASRLWPISCPVAMMMESIVTAGSNHCPTRNWRHSGKRSG